MTQCGRTRRPTTRTRAAVRAVALGVALAAAVVGCGSGGSDSGGGSATAGSGDESPVSDATSTATAAPAGSGAPAAARIEEVNKSMRETPFSGIGTTTAFGDGGLQQIVWNPGQGLRISYTGITGGDMYCEDGVTYMSADLFAKSLAAKGTEINVPDRLSDTYVTTQSGQGCDAYFVLPSAGTFAPDQDGTVSGVPARAITAAAGPTSDTYLVSAEDPARLLKTKSVRDGRTSSTTYTDFGKVKDVAVPSADRAMPMEEFRAQVETG